jgi:ubiquitin C-terminal hydrolase
MLNAKRKIVILVFREPLSIQNELYNAGMGSWCKEFLGMYVKSVNKKITKKFNTQLLRAQDSQYMSHDDISGSHGSEYEGNTLLRYCSV